ncbi:MAG: fibronectin type III domain-containing protein [Prevotella sp.]
MKAFTSLKRTWVLPVLFSVFTVQNMSAQQTVTLNQQDYTVPSWTQLQRALHQLKKADMPFNIVANVNGDPTNQIGIAWFTNAGVADGMVQYVEKADATEADFQNSQSVQANAVSADLRYLSKKNADFIAASGLDPETVYSYVSHKAVLTGLKPATTYCYRVGKEGAWSEIGSFTTATKGDVPFNFLYITDTQANTEEMFNITQTTVHSAVKLFPEASFVLCNGDFVESSGDKNSEWEWEQWMSTMQDVWLNYPLVSVQGNHDKSKNSNFFLHFNTDTTFNTLQADSVKTDMNGTVYSFVRNNALFLCINFEDVMKEGYPEALANWMRSEVEKHKDVKWRIATYHKTMFTGSKSHQSDQDEVREREKMLPVFEELNIDLALQGHDHIYEVIGPVDNIDKTLISDEVSHVEIVGPGNERENMTGKQGGVFNVAKGTLYFLNNSAGKKKYEPRSKEEMDEAASETQVNNYWGLFSGKFGQTGDPMFSDIKVTKDTIFVETYYVNAAGNQKLFDKFSIIKDPNQTAVKDVKAQKVSINVSDNGSVNVEGCHVDELLVYDLGGRIIKKVATNRVDVTDLPQGIYVVRVIDGNDLYTKKVRI